jgi:methyl-accepting chemotaxis protein
MNIRNLKIGKRLALGFGFLCVALVFMVGQGTIMLGRVNDGTDEIVNQRLPRMELTARMLSDVNDIAIALRNMMLDDSTDDRAKQLEKIATARKDLDGLLAQLDGLLRNPKSRTLLAQEVELNAKYTQGQIDLIRLIESGDDAGARTYLKTKLRPVLADYKAAIGQQIQVQADLATATARDAHAIYTNTRTLMIVLGAAMLAIACALAWWISASITRPLRRALDVATAVAGGDLTTRVDVDSTAKWGSCWVP